MKVTFENSYSPNKATIKEIFATNDIKIEGKPFKFNKVTMDCDDNFIVSTMPVQKGQSFEVIVAVMDGGKGEFFSLWTKEAHTAFINPIASAGDEFKEGQEYKVNVKVLDSKPKLRQDGTHSFYESKFGVMYHFTVTFEYKGKAYIATAQAKDAVKLPFFKGETADVMVTVKNGYVNVKKVAQPFGMKPSGNSLHGAWASVYAAHYMEARKSMDEQSARKFAIAAANEVIKCIEI